MTGAGWTTFGVAGKGQGQLSYPAQVGFDGKGHLLIADGSNGRIVQMGDMTGAGWTTLAPTCGFLGGVATDASGKIYFACDGGQIARVDDMTGANRVTVPLPGGPVTIDGISVDGAGSVYVGTARGIARVQGISAGGSTVTMYRGSLVDALGVAVR
jgi:streptogramin lyase